MPKTFPHKAIVKINNYVIIGFVLLSFLFDFMDKCELFYRIDFIKFNRIIKALVSIYAMVFIIVKWNYVFVKLYYVLYAFLALGLIFLIKFNYWDIYLDEYLRYSFFFLIYPILHFAFVENGSNHLKKTFYIVLKSFIVLNLVAVVMGLVFSVYVFRTYSGLQRFGYNGMLLSQGLTPFVYLAATLLFWHYKDRVMLVVVLLVSALSGIKGVYFGEFLLLLFLMLFDTNLNKKNKLKIAIMASIAFLLSIAILFTMPLFREVITNDGLISALFSFRTDNLIEIIQTSPPEQLNFLIGAFGIETVRVELQLADIVLFYGFLGLIIYLMFFWMIYKKTVLSTQSKIFFLSTLFLSFLSGNLLYNPLASILFLMSIFSVIKSTQHEKYNSTSDERAY